MINPLLCFLNSSNTFGIIDPGLASRKPEFVQEKGHVV